MKKKNIVSKGMSILLASVCMLAACTGKDTSRGSYTPEEEEPGQPQATPVAEEATPTPAPEDLPQPVDIQTGSNEIPVLCRSSRYKNFSVDQSGYDLLFDYQLLHTEREYGEAHPGLRDALEEVNEYIEEAAGEGCSGYAEILSGMSPDELKHARDMGDYPIYSYNTIYTRRADEKVLSYVVENRWFDFNDEYEQLSYSCHNFYVEDGSEVQLSDVVADEDAFYDLLAQRLSETMQDQLGEFLTEYTVTDPAMLREQILECIDMHEGGWVLEPQGISFYFESFTFMPWPSTVTILFSEDAEGDIFTSEYSNAALDEWVVELPKNCYINFDSEDDGVTDVIRVFDLYNPDNRSEYYFNDTIGTSVIYNGKYTEFDDDKEDHPYDFRYYLVHKEGKTVLLGSHSEYDFMYWRSYKLSGSRVDYADSIAADIKWIAEADQIWGEETIYPCMVFTDPDNLPTEASDDHTASGADNGINIEADGVFSAAGE